MTWAFTRDETLKAGDSESEYFGYSGPAFVKISINSAVVFPEDAAEIEHAISRAIGFIRLALDVVAAKRSKEDKELKDGSG